MTQKERQERSKEAIYHAALEEFGLYGYDGVNMERICGNHGISKGMMYHYYSNKNELFMLCVERTFAGLKAHIEQEMGKLAERSSLDAIKDYFMIRDHYFQLHPEQKAIFEAAMLRPPKHLAEHIRQLHTPIREMNRQFMSRIMSRMPLRPGLDREKATRYLESVDSFFQNTIVYYLGERKGQDLHSMLETAGEMLDMVLFGVLRQQDDAATVLPDPCQNPTRRTDIAPGA